MNSISIEEYTDRLVEDITDTITSEVFQAAEDALKDAIAETVYRKKSQMYMNTYQLLNAVKVSDLSIGNGFAEFEVVIDTDRLSVVPDRPDWPAYGSVSGSWSNDEGIIDTLDQGSSGSPFYNHSGYGFFDRAEGVMDANLVKAMARGLESRGYEISYR